MKKLLGILLLVFFAVAGKAQDEYYRFIDWKFYPSNVVQLTDSTYITDAYPFDYNDPGSIFRTVGNYIVDFVGHRYSVIDSTSSTLTVLDIYHIGQGPQTDQIARCYRSVYNGNSKYVGSVDYSPLDESARWKLNGSDNELLWRHGIDYWLPFTRLVLDTTYQHTGAEKKGTLSWDETTQSVETHISSDLHLNNGEELWVPLCYNNSGVDILNGQPVYINSASGTDPTIRLASNVTYDESRLIGVATQNIPNGSKGRVTRFGYVNDIDLSSCTSGSNVYLGDKVLTHIRPTGGAFPVVVGRAIVCTATGRLLVYPQGVEYTSEVNKVDGWPSYLQGEQTNLSFSDLTRTLFVEPILSSFYFYQAGVKYIKTGTQSFQISDVEGLHYIYYNLGDWGELVNPSSAQITEGIRNYTSVSVIYWDATNKKAIYVGNERHTFHWPFWVRGFIHTSFWTQYLSGLGLTNITLGIGSSNADAQFGVDAGSIADEDIITSTNAISSTTGLPIYYRSGSGFWRMTSRAGYSFLNDGTTGLAMYNLFSGGVWSLVSMTNNYYRLVHVFANNNLTNNVFCVSGTAQYSSAADAENGINSEVNNIYSGALPFAEAKYIGALILHTKTGLGNSVNARFVAIPSLPAGLNYFKDFRKSALQGYGGGVSGSLTFLGLSDTPDSYAGQANKVIGTSNLENGVEFKPVTIDGVTGSVNIPTTATYNKGGVPIISQTIDGSTTTLTASQKAIKDYADTKEPLLTKGNLTESVVGLQFNNTRQVIGGAADLSLTTGYIIPLTASVTAYDSHIVNTSNPHNVTKDQVGLGNVTNDAQVKRTEMGAANGVATLDPGAKVPMSQLPSSIIIYKGVWSPLTNTPTLADGVGTAGWVYKANLSGTVNFGSGNISFYAGDWVIYNGSTWEKSVGTDNVVSVNGQQGVVVLNTSHIAENTNLYYTDARARASVSETITGIDYSNSTGIFSQTSGYGIPTITQISQIHPQGTDIQAPTLVGDNIGLTQTTTTISIAGKEDKSNKVTSISGSSTDTQYPSAKLLYDQLALKQPLITGLTSGYLPYWDGSKLANSAFARESIEIYSLNGRLKILRPSSADAYQQIEVGDVNTTFNGQDTDGWMDYYFKSNGNTRFKINGNSGTINIPNLSGTGTRIVTATIDGTLNTNDALTNPVTANTSSFTGGKLIKSTGSGDQVQETGITVNGENNIGIGTSSLLRKLNIYDAAPGLRLISPDSNTGIEFLPGSTRYSWLVGAQYNVDEGFEITRSTTIGGTTFSNPIFYLLANGAGYFSGNLTAPSATLTDLTANTLLKADANKKIVSVANGTGLPSNDGAGNISYINYTNQSLSGTTPVWNVQNGINATITLTGNTTITLSNLVAGTSGNLEDRFCA